MNIRYWLPGKAFEQYEEEYTKAIIDTIRSGNLIMRDELEKFESELANYIGTKYAVGVNSGTDALRFALKALGIGKGDEVITVSHTFQATIEAIIWCGATPVLIDIDEYNEMDVSKIEAAITPKTKAILPVHLSGEMANMKEINKIAKKHNLLVVEDACQALGASYGTTKAGAWGDAGAFSFYPAKILGTFGDGGAVTTNSEEVYEKVKKLRNHWNLRQTGLVTKDTEPTEMEWAGNSRLDNVWAAVLSVKLKHINEILEKRHNAALRYDFGLVGVPCIRPRINPTTGFQYTGLPIWRVFQDYVIRTVHRNEMAAFLKQNGIECLGADQIPNHKRKGSGLEHYWLPKTEEVTFDSLRIPCNEVITAEEQDYVVEKIKEFYDSKNLLRY